jgi:peptide/nickel transport system permease protein
MLSGSGRTFMYHAPWMALWPAPAISLAVFGFNMFGDALRDLLDPGLARSQTRPPPGRRGGAAGGVEG